MVAITTDRGVEKGLVHVPSVNFGAVFPFFVSQAQGFEVDGGDAHAARDIDDGQAEQAEQETYSAPADIDPTDVLSLECALDVAGAMHALSNASKAMLTAMPNYESFFFPLLNALVRFLHAPWQRSRFCELCLTGPLEPLRGLFKTFSLTIVQWRWLTLTAVIPELLLRQNALEAAWSPDLMGVKVQDAGNDNGEGEAAADRFAPMQWDLVHQAIKSREFWAWLHMLEVLTRILSYLESWFFDCPCHAEEVNLEDCLLVLSGLTRQVEGVRKDLQARKHSCVFRGRRGPEIASGDLLCVLDHMLAAANHRVTLVVLPACDSESQGRIVADFEAAKQHLLFHLRVQFSSWSHLPRVLLGVHHLDEAKARQCAVSALTQWRNMSDAQRGCAHKIAVKFCKEGPLRQALVQFVRGQPLVGLPQLRLEVFRLALVNLCEMSVERMHAVTQSVLRSGSARSSMPTLSLGNRWNEFLSAVQQPGQFAWMAAACQQSYHPLRAAPVFGIVEHPSLGPRRVAECQGNPSLLRLLGSTMKYSKTVKNIVYRTDSALQHMDLSQAFPPQQKQSKITALALHGLVFDTESLLNHEAVKAFSLLVWLQREGGLEELEFDDPEVGVGVFEGKQGVRPQHPAVAPAPEPGSPPDDFFFRVISKSPSLQKKDAVSTMLGFASTDIAVARHQVLQTDLRNGTALIEAAATFAMPVAMLERTSGELQSQWILPATQASHIRHARVWEADEILHCKGIDSSLVTPETQALLEHAAERHAWPGTTAVLHTDLLDKEEMDLLKDNPKCFAWLPAM